MTLPFNKGNEEVTITVPSGHDFQVVYSTTIEDARIAIGRIGQDIAKLI